MFTHKKVTNDGSVQVRKRTRSSFMSEIFYRATDQGGLNFPAWTYKYNLRTKQRINIPKVAIFCKAWLPPSHMFVIFCLEHF